MTKQNKIYLGVGLLLATVAGFYFFTKKPAKKPASQSGSGTSSAEANEQKPVGKLSADKIPQADKEYIQQNSGLTNFQGVDYADAKNTKSANDSYLKAYPDIASSWQDKDDSGNVVGWSHYVIWGQKEGRVWPV